MNRLNHFLSGPTTWANQSWPKLRSTSHKYEPLESWCLDLISLRVSSRFDEGKKCIAVFQHVSTIYLTCLYRPKIIIFRSVHKDGIRWIFDVLDNILRIFIFEYSPQNSTGFRGRSLEASLGFGGFGGGLLVSITLKYRRVGEWWAPYTHTHTMHWLVVDSLSPCRFHRPSHARHQPRCGRPERRRWPREGAELHECRQRQPADFWPLYGDTHNAHVT